MIRYELKCDGEIMSGGKMNNRKEKCCDRGSKQQTLEQTWGSGVPSTKLALVLEVLPLCQQQIISSLRTDLPSVRELSVAAFKRLSR